MKGTTTSRISTGGFALLIVLIGLSVAVTGGVAGEAADITVAQDGSGDYTSIQNAADSTSDGDRIEVMSGTYQEDLYITSNVTIVAPNGATITNTSAIDDGTGVTWRNPVGPKIVGFTFTGWRQAINADGPDASSDGDWEVRDSTIIGGSCAVCAPTTEGGWTLENVTIRDADTAVSAYDNGGDWVIRNSKFQESGGILAYESSGNWEVDNVTIRDATDNAINVGNSSGDWTVSDTVINNSGSDAIFGEDTGGDWTISSTVVKNAEDNGIEVDGSSGNWIIRNTTVSNMGEEGIDMADSSGDMQIIGTTVRNTSEGEYNNAIEIEDSIGDWTIQDTTIENISGEGIDAYNQPESSQAIIQNLTVTDTQNHGVNFYNSSGDWNIIDSYISNNEWSGVEASDSTGNWNITNTTIKNADDFLIGARRATGTWQIHESKLVTSDIAVNANDATEGNASHNYWDASDGPSGDFGGSGVQIVGNLIIEPYYIDSELTTLDTDSDANIPPEAAFSYEPSAPTNGTVVTFNASGSTDSDGAISSYKWDFDNNGTTDATGEVVTHTYQNTGDYTVVLAVTDEAGTTDTITRTIGIAPNGDNGNIPSDTVYNPDSAAANYDENIDGQINLTELASAGAAYTSGELGLTELASVGAAYSRSST